MMGASASAGWGGAAIYTDLVAGVERARRGYGVARVEKRVVKDAPKRSQNRTARRPRFGSAWRPRFGTAGVSNILF